MESPDGYPYKYVAVSSQVDRYKGGIHEDHLARCFNAREDG